jgi:hypothetical protein
MQHQVIWSKGIADDINCLYATPSHLVIMLGIEDIQHVEQVRSSVSQTDRFVCGTKSLVVKE